MINDRFFSVILKVRASLVTQMVKNLSAMRETCVPSLDWEDPLEKGKATHFSILAWRIPWTVQSMGLQRVRQDWATFTFTFRLLWVRHASQVALVMKNPATNAGDVGDEFNPWVGKIPWRRLPIPVFWRREFHGLYSLWGCKELGTTEWLSCHT